MRAKFIVILGGVFLVSGLYAGVGAQGKTVNDGIYSDEQAKRGDVLYKEQCATCHGDNLEGSGPMPALAGKDFLASWMGKSVADLFEKTHTTMPATAPGSLTPAQAADITAYMLASSKFKAGTTELEGKVEALKDIKIEAPK
jgi:S-disulfanyl-L-cysteine oxidoreductase SoxD